MHRWMSVRETHRGDVIADLGQTQRLWMLDQQSQQPFTVGKVGDPGDNLCGHAGVHEPHQPPVGDHAERGLAGIDELPGGTDDVLQDRIQIGSVRDREIGTQQPTQSTLSVLDVAGPGDQLLQQVVEFQSAGVDESKIRYLVTHCIGHSSTYAASGTGYLQQSVAPGMNGE